MNVLFLTSVYPDPRHGGVERVTTTLAALMRAEGMGVAIVSWQGPGPGHEVQPGVAVMPEGGAIRCDANREFLARHISDTQPGVIINQAEQRDMLLLAREAKGAARLVTVVHTDPACCAKSAVDSRDAELAGARGIGRWLRMPAVTARYAVRLWRRRRYQRSKYAEVAALSDAVAVLSRHYEPVFRRVSGCPAATIVAGIPDPLTYGPLPRPQAKERVVLYVGRLCAQAKRPDRLLRIWERSHVAGWRLVIVGDGEERGRLEATIRRRRLPDVELTGRADPAPWYAKASILCMTSTSEGFGAVLTEALQHGVVPMAFDSYEAVRDIITPGVNGELVRPFSLRSYARRLRRLMADPEALERCRQGASPEALEKFGPAAVMDGWRRLFERLDVNDKDTND